MNPLEAMCRAYCVSGGFDPDEKMPNDGPRWRYYEPGMRAAIDALANNVNEKMTTTYLSTRVSNTATRNINALSIAAAIRAAGEE